MNGKLLTRMLERLPVTGAVDDAVDLAVAAGYTFNGAAWDRQRGNSDGTLLASAARTTHGVSASQVNHNARGVLLFLRVTAASGTGGLVTRVQVISPVTGDLHNINLAPAAITTAGLFTYLVYPGATETGGLTQVTPSVLPRRWRAAATAADATSYTYSLGFSLIL